MYGIAAHTDLNFLRRKTLIQVCFGSSDLQLRFAEEGVVISIESTVGYELPSGGFQQRTIGKDPESTDVLADPIPLLKFLHRRIEDVEWTVEGTITLKFNEGGRLQIYDDSNQFESYNIHHHDKLFVI